MRKFILNSNWQDELRKFFTEYDFSGFVLEINSGKEFQFGSISQNKKLFLNVQKELSNYFSKPGDLGACLLYLKDHSIDELLNKLECPVCHKFNGVFRFNRQRCDEHVFCSRDCRYSLEGKTLLMNRYKEKTGYDSPYSNPKVQQKRKENFLRNYGVESPMQVEEFKKRNIESNRNNHCGLLACQTEEVKLKIKETNLKNHQGVFNLQLPETKEKLIKLSNERYGVDFPIANSDIRNRQERLYDGVGLASDIIRKKAEETFGGPLNGSNPIIFEKMKQTVENKTGKSFEEAVTENMQRGLKEKFGDEIGFANEKIAAKIQKQVVEKFNVPYFCLTDKCRQANKKTISKRNVMFAEKVRKLGYEVGLDSVKLETFSYDVCLEKEKILIEIDPSFTHNSTRNPFGSVRSQDYHLRKSEVARKFGYRCIHIFDWDDEKKVLGLFEKCKRIYARKCEVRVVDFESCSEFLNRYSLTNKMTEEDICFGLFYQDKLFQVMVLGRPRKNDSVQYEMLHFCSRNGFRIVGGLSKLFSYFKNSFKPESVVSYCDSSKFEGTVYEILGFHKVGELISVCHLSKKKQQLIIDDNDKKKELIEKGFVEVFDCGYQKYLFYAK